MPSIDQLLLAIGDRLRQMRSENPQRFAGLALVTTVVLLVLAWYFRPWLHGIVYGVYTTPVLPFAAVVGLGIAALARRRFGSLASGQFGFVVFVLVLVAGAGLTGFLAGEDIGKSTMDSAATTENLSETDPA